MKIAGSNYFTPDSDISYNRANMFPFPCTCQLMLSNVCPYRQFSRIQKHTAVICKMEQNHSRHFPKDLMKFSNMHRYLARDATTFIRLAHLIKPNRRSASIWASAANVRTVDTKMIFRSSPWNSSTVPIFTTFKSSEANMAFSRFTCNAYGVTIPISLSRIPALPSLLTNARI